MKWMRHDVSIMAKCLEATFSMTGEDGAEHIEGVGRFKYLERLLYWSDDNWSEVLSNTRKARQIWERLGKLLRREGGGADSLIKVLPRGSEDSTLVWSRDMSAPR